MRWFRFHVDAIHDHKLIRLAFEDRWHYVALLCLKADGTLDELDEPDDRDHVVGLKLGLGSKELEHLKNRLQKVRLIDEKWQPTGWDRRQYKSDVSTERVRRFRSKQTEQNQKHNGMKRRRNVSETPPETDSETETDKRGARKRAGPPPKDFRITDGMRAWATGKNVRVDLDLETEKFLNHAKATGRALRDWDAGWRNWILKSAEYDRRDGGGFNEKLRRLGGGT